jgi:predicted dehydrogenase
MKLPKIKTSIIGMGKMGKIRYDSLKRHDGFEIVSLCDINSSNLVGYNEPLFSDWKECIDVSGINALVICTYNAYIPDIVCYALNKGIHVFSEKPPGRNLSDTLRMQTALNESGGQLKFGFNHRYHNSVIEAKSLIDSGMLGDVVCARGVYGKAGSFSFTTEWRNNVDLSGGGILLDQGIHMLDLLGYFMGKFVEIKSMVDQLVWKEIETEDSAFIIMKTGKGKVASLHSSALQWKHKFDLDLICTDGFIALNGILTATQSYGQETISYYKKDLQPKNNRLGRPLEHTVVFDVDNSWDLEIKEFYDVIMYKYPLRHGTIEQAIGVMELIEKIYTM